MQLLGNWIRVSLEIGQHHQQIMAMMQKIASATREALTILAREATQGQQGQSGLPAQPESQPTGASTVPPPAAPQGYPPSGY
jgi:hypothetical protein